MQNLGGVRKKESDWMKVSIIFNDELLALLFNLLN
jgi:hypothetical protein